MNTGAQIQSRRPAMNSKRWDRRLFIRCSPTLTEQELLTLLERFGKVINFALLRNANGDSKGGAYVTYSKLRSAACAKAELHGKTVGGKLLYVQKADKPDANSSVDSPPGSRIFVDGPKTMTEDELHQWFSRFGHIEHIVSLKESVLRQSSGAFVKFSKAYMATSAVAASHALQLVPGSCPFKCRVATPRNSHFGDSKAFYPMPNERLTYPNNYSTEMQNYATYSHSGQIAQALQQLGFVCNANCSWSRSIHNQPQTQQCSLSVASPQNVYEGSPEVFTSQAAEHGMQSQQLMEDVESVPSAPIASKGALQVVPPNSAPTLDYQHNQDDVGQAVTNQHTLTKQRQLVQHSHTNSGCHALDTECKRIDSECSTFISGTSAGASSWKAPKLTSCRPGPVLANAMCRISHQSPFLLVSSKQDWASDLDDYPLVHSAPATPSGDRLQQMLSHMFSFPEPED